MDLVDYENDDMIWDWSEEKKGYYTREWNQDQGE